MSRDGETADHDEVVMVPIYRPEHAEDDDEIPVAPSDPDDEPVDLDGPLNPG